MLSASLVGSKGYYCKHRWQRADFFVLPLGDRRNSWNWRGTISCELKETTCENPANKDEAMVKIGEIIAWGQLVNIIPSESANIVVLCGSADEVCASLEALISVSIGAVPLYSCPGVLNASKADDLFNCEANLMKT